MNHRPFEDWLLDDEPLTLQQQRELQIHLRSCTNCSALASSNVALHSRRMIAPAPGFTERFQPRLTAWKKEQLRRQAIGTVILVLAGLATLYVLAGPVMLEAIRSPATWLSRATVYAVELFAVARVIEQVGSILLRLAAGIFPSSAWGILMASGGALSLIWIFAMRRLARAPRGA